MSDNPYQSPQVETETKYVGPRFRWRVIPCVALIFFGLPATLLGIIGPVMYLAGLAAVETQDLGLAMLIGVMYLAPGICLLTAAAGIWWMRWRIVVAALLGVPVCLLLAYVLFELFFGR